MRSTGRKDAQRASTEARSAAAEVRAPKEPAPCHGTRTPALPISGARSSSYGMSRASALTARTEWAHVPSACKSARNDGSSYTEPVAKPVARSSRRRAHVLLEPVKDQKQRRAPARRNDQVCLVPGRPRVRVGELPRTQQRA